MQSDDKCPLIVSPCQQRWHKSAGADLTGWYYFSRYLRFWAIPVKGYPSPDSRVSDKFRECTVIYRYLHWSRSITRTRRLSNNIFLCNSADAIFPQSYVMIPRFLLSAILFSLRPRTLTRLNWITNRSQRSDSFLLHDKDYVSNYALKITARDPVSPRNFFSLIY